MAAQPPTEGSSWPTYLDLYNCIKNDFSTEEDLLNNVKKKTISPVHKDYVEFAIVSLYKLLQKKNKITYDRYVRIKTFCPEANSSGILRSDSN